MNINGREYSESELRAYIKELQVENRKAKELLKAAVETINEYACGFCMICKNHDNNEGCCMLDKGCQDNDNWQWALKDKALAIIGEDGEHHG